MSAKGFLRKLVRVVPPVDLAFSACEAIGELFKTDPEEVKKALELDPKDIGLDFGEAIEALKEGEKVARVGWNGRGMFVYLVSGTMVDKENLRNEAFTHMKDHCDSTGVVEIGSHIDMKAVDGKVVVGWLASQTDMLAEDWEIVD